MSTTRRAERALFGRLIDDAAVFPPGLAPLEQAVRDHLRRRRQPYADLVGPLLVPTSAARRLRDALLDRGPDDDAALAVGLVARPGTPLASVTDALVILEAVPALRVVGVEIAHQPDWAQALAWDLPLAVEVPREREPQRAALAALLDATDEAVELRAKLRTQSTATAPVPSAEELAAFVAGCSTLGLPFKLTGGLHRAVAHTARDPDGRREDQHGLLNVLLATHLTADGADPVDVVNVLLARDGDSLADAVARLTAAEAARVRAALTAYGCCGVNDPIEDLTALGLVSEDHDGPDTATDEEEPGR